MIDMFHYEKPLKKLIKLITLSFALSITAFVLNTKAATGHINLQIIGTSGTCEFGNTSSLGATTFSFGAQTLSGGFTGTSLTDWHTRLCFDSNGVASWNAAMVSNNLVNQSNGAYTIPASAVSYSNYAVWTWAGSGACTSITWASTSPTDWKALGSSQMYLQKISAIGEVCKVQTTGMFLRVIIPAGTNIGTYSGTITITAPTF